MAVWATQAGKVIHACIVVWALPVATVIGCVIPQPVSSLSSASLASVTEAAVSAGVSAENATSPSPTDSVTVSPSSPAASSELWTPAPSPSALATSLTPAWETPVASTAIAIGTTSSGSWIISPTATLSPVGHFVEVGGNHQPSPGDRLFFPAQIHAQRGDLIEFRLSAPYELYLSSLSRPCDSMLPVLNDRVADNASSVFNFVVLDSDPTWFYTSRAGESPSCSNRSVFAVNPGGNLGAFLANADVDSRMPEQV